MSKAEQTRQFIIEKAAGVLNKKGMAGTSISDIMEATKLAKGGIYGNFENKDEICLEAFNFLSGRQASRIEATLSEIAKPKDKLYAIADHYTSKEKLDNHGGCPILNFGTEADDTNPVVRHRVGEAIKTAQRRISRIVQAGIDSRDFKKNTNPDEFAIKMFTMMEGAILVSRTFGSMEQMNVVNRILKAEIEALSN
jgi:TetR/AcrR family transcriptional repressor of nem operon